MFCAIHNGGVIVVTKIRTGIAGFDELFHGGILEGSTVLVEGIPGAGKTTLGMEFIYRGVQDYGEPGVVLTFEQIPEALYRDASNFGWDLQELERQNKLRVLCTSPEVVLLPESNFLEDVVRETGARRVLVDSMSHFRQVIEDPVKLRQAVYAFCNGLRRLHLTSLLVQEQEQQNGDLHGFEEFIVDAVVRLSYGSMGGLRRRRIVEIIKSRGQPHVTGKHSFKITAEGIQVYSLRPRLPKPEELRTTGTPVKTGIHGLDELLQGGLPRGTTIVVAGEAGTGKSVLGLGFLVKGVLLQEKGIFISLEESASQIVTRAAAFGWDLPAFMRAGMLEVSYMPFVDIDLDEFIIQIGNFVRQHRINRLVLDSLPTLINCIRDLPVLREKLFYLTSYLNNLGCTTLLLYPIGIDAANEQFGVVQSLVQGSIILKFTLFRNRRLRLLELYKLRGVSHVTGNHLMEITRTGIQVFPRLGGW